MAYSYDPNEKPASFGACLYQLIANLVTAGWTFKASGAGVVTPSTAAGNTQVSLDGVSFNL